jgi:predicted transcriptional regulator
MKKRVTLTIDPEVVARARRLAHARSTSVSALIEGFVRRAPLAEDRAAAPFADRWAGRFTVRRSAGLDARLEALKDRYRLGEP